MTAPLTGTVALTGSLFDSPWNSHILAILGCSGSRWLGRCALGQVRGIFDKSHTRLTSSARRLVIEATYTL